MGVRGGGVVVVKGQVQEQEQEIWFLILHFLLALSLLNCEMSGLN